MKFVGFVDAAGRFEIPDVPAGDYRLRLPINLPPNPQGVGAGDEIGRAELVFNIPDMPGGRSDEPLDLGTIEAKRFDSLDPGEIAPEFVVQGLKGEPVAVGKPSREVGPLELLVPAERTQSWPDGHPQGGS